MHHSPQPTTLRGSRAARHRQLSRFLAPGLLCCALLVPLHAGAAAAQDLTTDLVVSAAPPAPAVDVNDILTRLGDDDFATREKASADLEAAFKGGKLTASQKAALVGVAYGRAQGSDLEVKWRTRKLVTKYLPKEFAAVAAITDPLKITIVSAGGTITYNFSNFNGRFTTDSRNTDFQRFQRLVDKLRNQVEAGEFAKAKATLDDIDGFFGPMSGPRFNNMGLGNGGLDTGDIRVRTGRVRSAIDAATGQVGDEGDEENAANDSVDATESVAGELALGTTFQVSVDQVTAPGTFEFWATDSADDVSYAELPPDGFQYVGNFFVLSGDDSLQLGGNAQVSLIVDTDPTLGPGIDLSQLQLARVANGQVEILASSSDAATSTLSATYAIGADGGPDPLGIFVLVAPAGLVTSPTPPTPPAGPPNPTGPPPIGPTPPPSPPPPTPPAPPTMPPGSGSTTTPPPGGTGTPPAGGA